MVARLLVNHTFSLARVAPPAFYMESTFSNPTDVCLGDSTRSEYSSRGTITHLFETAPKLLGSGEPLVDSIDKHLCREDKPAAWNSQPYSSSTPPYVPTSPVDSYQWTSPPFSSVTPTYNPTSPAYAPCSPSYVPSDELYKPLPTSLKRDREGVEVNVPSKRMRTGDASVKVKDIPCIYENSKQGCLKGPYLCRFKHTRVGFRIDDKVVVVRGDMQGCEGFVVGVDSTGTYTIELTDICADELLVERGTELEFSGDTLEYPFNRFILKEHVPTAEKQCRFEFKKGGCKNPSCHFKHTSKNK